GHEVADLSQQLLGGRSGSFLVTAEATVVDLVELGEWRNDEEVDHSGDNQEVDDGGDNHAKVNEGVFIVGDLETKASHISGAERVDDRLDQGVSNRGDDCRKGSTDDDTNCQIDDVAAHNEIFKDLEHDLSFSGSGVWDLN